MNTNTPLFVWNVGYCNVHDLFSLNNFRHDQQATELSLVAYYRATAHCLFAWLACKTFDFLLKQFSFV